MTRCSFGVKNDTPLSKLGFEVDQNKIISTLPPKADMCRVTTDVSFGAIADVALVLAQCLAELLKDRLARHQIEMPAPGVLKRRDVVW